MSKVLMEHPFYCSASQMRKVMTGGAITLKPEHFAAGGDTSMMLHPATARRVATAMRKNKGLRIQLKDGEHIMEGGSIKSVGRSIKKGFQKAGKVIKKGFNKEIVQSGVGKEIAKGLIRAGTQVVLPALAGAAGTLTGNPMLGAMAGELAGNELQRFAEKKGYGMKKGKGLFKTLHKLGAHKIGITKKSVTKFAKKVGNKIIDEGSAAVGAALTAYTGNPMAASAFENVVAKGARTALNTGNVKKAMRQGVRAAKRVGAEFVDDYIDKNLTGVEKEVAQNALAGKYPSAGDLVYDYGNSKIEEMNMGGNGALIGGGVGRPFRSRGGLRLKRHNSKFLELSPPIMGQGIEGIHSLGRPIHTIQPPSSVIQTGSPYASINSPAMSPFIAGSHQLVNKSTRRVGGSFLPA